MAEQALAGARPSRRSRPAPRRPRQLTFDLKRQPGFRTVALLCLAMLYAPILILVGFAFNDQPIGDALDEASAWTGSRR